MPQNSTAKYLLWSLSHLQKRVVNDGSAIDEVGPPGGVERVDGVGAAASSGELDERPGIEVIGHVGPIDGRNGT